MEERREEPTRAKLKKARSRGEAAKSPALAGATLFLTGICLVWALAPLLAQGFRKSLRNALTAGTLEGAFQRVVEPLILPMLFALIGLLATAICAHLLQTGWIWAPERIKPKWRKKKAERQFVRPLLQCALIFAVGYFAIRKKIDPNLLFSSPQEQASYLFHRIIGFALLAGFLLFLLGLGDFFYQKWRYAKQMRMTRQQKREELRESEGDPAMKKEMRSRRD